MDVSKLLGGALAVNRTLFGLNYLLRPQQAGPTWIGRVARKPRRASALAVGVAAASTAVAAVSAIGVDPGEGHHDRRVGASPHSTA